MRARYSPSVRQGVAPLFAVEDARLLAGGVDAQLGEVEGFVVMAATALATDDGAEAGGEFAGFEGFGEVVVGAAFQSEDFCR